MTYRSRGRSIVEVILAVCFVGFLVGFITVLCIGNYFRAKRAQERQAQRRMSKQSNKKSERLLPNQGYAGSVADSTTSGNQGYEAPGGVIA